MGPALYWKKKKTGEYSFYQIFSSVQFIFCVLGPMFVGGFFQELLIFCDLKNVFLFFFSQKILNSIFFTNHVFTIHVCLKLFTTSPKHLLAIFTPS